MQNRGEVGQGYIVQGGRPRKMTQEQLDLALQLYFRERMSLREVADALRVSHMTIWRVLARVPAEEVTGTEWARAHLGEYG